MSQLPWGDHAANGDAEGAVNLLSGLLRTNKIALEERIGSRIGSTRPILQWMLEYVGTARSLYKVNADGRTHYERRRGKAFKREMVPFGQCVVYQVRPKRRPKEGVYLGKLEGRFEEGGSWA